jgi:hypothetical protein
MKLLFLLAMAAAMVSPMKCNKGREPVAADCYKGRLEIKGICANYTIALLEGSLDSSKIVALLTDENTGRTYKNVFALGSPCSFPDNISEGQEFYFTLDAPEKDCAVCQAFYPVPPKPLAIKVLDKPCR